MDKSRSAQLARLAGSGFFLALVAACGGGSGSLQEQTQAVQMQVGPSGGTVNGPDGVQVVVPAGALAEAVTIGIARSSEGAPTGTPVDYPSAKGIYEFTPHGLVFEKPVTLRVPGTSAGTGAVLMAAPGEDWEYQGAVVTDGTASWQRNSFSWGYVGAACAPQNRPPWSSSNPDPYPCVYPRGHATVSATAPAALTALSTPDAFGNAGSWQVTQAGVLTFTLNYQVAPDCENPRAKLVRWNPKASGTPQVLFDGSVPLTSAIIPPPPGSFGTGGAPVQRGIGSHSVDVSFGHADNAINSAGLHAFSYRFSCNRPGRSTQSGGELMTLFAAIPAPAAPITTYSVGGNVSGLASTGLVLQNNAADDLAVAVNGAFTFATPLAAGAAYAAGVKTQPNGQTCTVANGAGTVTANVTGIAVSCVTDPLPVWSVPQAVSPAGADSDQVTLAAAADGTALVSWVQYDAAPESQYNLYASRFTGGSWQAPQSIETLQSNLSQSLSGGVFTPVASVHTGRSVVAYGFSPQGGTYQTAVSWLGGTGWESQLLHFGNNSHSGTVSLTGDGGAAIVLYAQYDGSSAYTLRSQTLDFTGTPPIEQQVAPGSANEPAVVPMPGGDVLAVWNAGSLTRASRYFGAGKVWSAAPTDLDSAGFGYPPALAANASGTAVASWLSLGNSSNRYEAWAARYASGSWGLPVKLAPLAGENQVEDNFDSDLASTAAGIDAGGNAYVAWTQDVTGGGQNAHVLVRRCPAAQAITNCEAATTLDTANEWAGMPSLVVAPNGEVWVAWVAIQLPSRDKVLRVAFRAASSGSWSAATTVATGLSSDAAPALAVDGLSRASVAWRGTDRRIYVSRRQ